MSRLGVTAERLFHPPRNSLERSFFQVGLYYNWQMYGREGTPRTEKFRGYTLFADPYHAGLKRISFLMGADCSHFVHRLFQLLGAHYSYAKTRHFIFMGRALSLEGTTEDQYRSMSQTSLPLDFSLEAMKELAARFEKVPADPARLRPGDVLVEADEVGPRGIHGHIAIVTGVGADQVIRTLHSGGEDRGIEHSTFATADLAKSFAFRWKGALTPLKARTLEALLEAQYEFDPTRCTERLKQ